MMMDPGRLFRRWRAFQAEVAEEVSFLIERHGPEAVKAARERLARDRLSGGERRVLNAAIRRLAR